MIKSEKKVRWYHFFDLHWEFLQLQLPFFKKQLHQIYTLSVYKVKQNVGKMVLMVIAALYMVVWHCRTLDIDMLMVCIFGMTTTKCSFSNGSSLFDKLILCVTKTQSFVNTVYNTFLHCYMYCRYYIHKYIVHTLSMFNIIWTMKIEYFIVTINST